MVRQVVGGVKRSPAYRYIASKLGSRCPLDIWIEDDLGFAQFVVNGIPHEGILGWVVFAVRMADGQVVAAKSLTPDELGQQIIVSEL
ncbi:MAG: hypothetical protein HY268_21680 [Deltaproteobacteria bacterium]|nr:hypothetical protein [Deltaproteobacteria bacterium]